MSLNYNALQLGIRRGNLSLVRTSFEEIWAGVTKRDLTWRIPSIIAFESFYMLYQVANFLKEDQPKDAWLKFLLKMAMATKVKDAEALVNIASLGELSSKEINIFKKVAQYPMERVITKLIDARKYTKEESLILDICFKRTTGTGRYLDKLLFLAVAVILCKRSIRTESIEEKLKANIARYKKETVSKKIEIMGSYPWYIYDASTEEGKKVVKVFFEKYAGKFNLTMPNLRRLWWYEQSYTPLWLTQFGAINGAPNMLTTYYWPKLFKDNLTFCSSKMKAIDNKNMWDLEIKIILKKLFKEYWGI